MGKLTVAQLQDLAQIYKHILLDAGLLIETAARKNTTVRGIYENVVNDLAAVEAEIMLANKQEGVKA